MKEFGKSVKNRQSYCYKFGILLFWDTVYIQFVRKNKADCFLA